MLVLLVAFVITIPALTNAIHVNLPRTVSTTARTAEGHHDHRGQAGCISTISPWRPMRSRAQHQGGDRRSNLHLRADDRVPYGSVAKVMAEIEHSGIAKVSVLTDNQ